MRKRCIGQIGAVVLGLLLVLTGCVYTPVKGHSEKRTVKEDYLTFWYKRQILPAFVAYREKTDELTRAAYAVRDAQEGAGKEAAVEQLKALYKETFLCLQDLILFDNALFHSGISGLYELAGTSQVNKGLVKSGIGSGRITADEMVRELEEGLNQPNAAGFAALDYILFSGEIALNAASIRYVCTVCEVIGHYAKEAERHYKENEEAFLAHNDFSAGSSLSTLINTLMKQYEIYVRTIKVGIPIGIYGAAIVQKRAAPQTVEGYYCGGGLSTRLLHRSILSLKHFYDGVPYGESAPLTAYSFGHFLEEQLAVTGQGEDLVNQLRETLYLLERKIGKLEGDIAVLADSTDGLERLTDVYRELQKIVGILKAKIIVELKLTITYSDGEEGD